jgi:hypothetical protein
VLNRLSHFMNNAAFITLANLSNWKISYAPGRRPKARHLLIGSIALFGG